MESCFVLDKGSTILIHFRATGQALILPKAIVADDVRETQAIGGVGVGTLNGASIEPIGARPAAPPSGSAVLKDGRRGCNGGCYPCEIPIRPIGQAAGEDVVDVS